MKIAILTNDDLTGNLIFSPLVGMPGVAVETLLFSNSPMKGRNSKFAAAFGLMKRMDFRYWLFLVVTNGFFALFSHLGRLLGLPAEFGDLRSLRSRADKAGITIGEVADFNSAETRQKLRDCAVDLLVIRVSAILDADLLAIPRLGTWCVHSSLLPAYGGIAGEFQALREDQRKIGSTVFEVTPKLDEGPALAQTIIPVRQEATLFSHIVANNCAAGQLLATMVEDLAAGKDPRRPLLNAGLKESYFSWPKTPQVSEFRRKGKRLISIAEILALLLSTVRLCKGCARFSSAVCATADNAPAKGLR